MGYGARALKALNTYYSGEYFNLDESIREEASYPDPSKIDTVSQSRQTISYSNLLITYL